MKIEGKIKCPHCGSNKTHAYQYTEVNLWDDEFYNMLNKEYPKDDKLNCDNIVYKCKCDEENCNKYFIARVKLKCEIEDVLTIKRTEEVYNNYFKK